MPELREGVGGLGEPVAILGEFDQFGGGEELDVIGQRIAGQLAGAAMPQSVRWPAG